MSSGSPSTRKQFGIALSSYGKAWDFILQHGLWKFFFVSLIVSVLIWVGGYYAIDWFSETLSAWITSLVFGWLGLDGDGMIAGAIVWTFSFLLKVVVWIIFLTIHKYVLLIVISPLMAYISERVDEIITGRKYPFNGDQMMRDVVRGILISLRNMFIELGFTVVFFVISFIPVIGWIVSLVGMFVVSSYFYGFSMMDYTNERRKLNIKQSVAFIRAHRGLAVGNGTVFSSFFLIPILGKFIAPVIAPIWSVVAATLAINEIVDLKKSYGNK